MQKNRYYGLKKTLSLSLPPLSAASLSLSLRVHARLHGARVERHRLGPLAQRVAAQQRPDRLDEQLDVVERVARHDRLVQVRVERHLLHVRRLAHLDERLAGRVGPIEDLLEDVEDLVRRPVLLVELLDVGPERALACHARAAGRGRDDLLGGHAARLGGEVDALAGALGDVARGVADQRDAALDAARARVLRDRVRLDADDLPPRRLDGRAVARRLLVLLDRRLVDDGAGSCGWVFRRWWWWWWCVWGGWGWGWGREMCGERKRGREEVRGRRKRVERHVLLAHPRTRKNLFQNKKTQNKTEKTKRLTDSDVVVLGEDPPVKVGRDVVADVHLRQVAVVGHLVLGDADALLEGDGVVVLPGVDLLGDAGVGAVGADDLEGEKGGGGEEGGGRK